MRTGLPPVQQEYFPLVGGLDLLTPQISIGSGKCFDAQNYEPEIEGGYSRIWGYERYDGTAAPSAAGYWLLSATITGLINVGVTVTGATSAATGKVLAVVGTRLVLGRLTGAFLIAEPITVSSVVVGATLAVAMASNAGSASDDADYSLLAANDIRAGIGLVPGSGSIRGVAIYNDTVYAFRDNALGTAGVMWKATSSGWTQVAFKSEVLFTAATAQISVGSTITGATSGATATVVVALLRTGTWTVAGAGSLVITPVSGLFSAGEVIKVGATSCATTSGVSGPIVRLPGGRFEYDNGNFTGSTATLKMYGADGVNPAFEFDGINYVPIHTGMAADIPTHVKVHKSSLFLSFLGSVQFSSLGNPYGWSVVTGAGEIGTGDPVTAFVPQGGTVQGSSLAIFTMAKTYMLYGSTSANFTLTSSVFDVGCSPFTVQAISNNTFGLTARGIQSLITTMTYGDFDYQSVSHQIQPLMTAKYGTETASTALKQSNQYRVYYNDGTAIVVGITGDKVTGIMPLNYGRVVRCMTTATLSSGVETCIFGSDDGYVYQDGVGTSFDGGLIEAWIRPAFTHSKSPRTRKRYRRSVFEIKPYGFSSCNISYELGYASPAVLSPVGVVNSAFFGGGFWDQFTWEHFTWDAPVVSSIVMALTGTEKNISFLFYSNRAQDKKHTVQGITLNYTSQRQER